MERRQCTFLRLVANHRRSLPTIPFRKLETHRLTAFGRGGNQYGSRETGNSRCELPEGLLSLVSRCCVISAAWERGRTQTLRRSRPRPPHTPAHRPLTGCAPPAAAACADSCRGSIA